MDPVGNLLEQSFSYFMHICLAMFYPVDSVIN